MYHIVYSPDGGCWTVGTGTPGRDWEPVADFPNAFDAMIDAERRNSPHVYALLDKARSQIDEVLARLDRLEKAMRRSAQVDNENNPDWKGY